MFLRPWRPHPTIHSNPSRSILRLNQSVGQYEAVADPRKRAMKIQYLEIVTKEVDAVCAAYAQL